MWPELWLLAACSLLVASSPVGPSSQLESADTEFPVGHPPDYPVDNNNFLPRATQSSMYDDENGWTPKPTEGPSLELVQEEQLDWTNVNRVVDWDITRDSAQICGWRSGVLSK